MSRQYNTSPDIMLVGDLANDPDHAMQQIFQTYYQEVCQHIFRLVPNKEICEDIAQSIFLELWQKRRELEIRTSVGAYLHKMAVSRTLNYIRDNKKHRHRPEEDAVVQVVSGESPLQLLLDDELREIVARAVEGLPERCRLVFVLSRQDGMSYKEIARELDISTKTVENQISKALQLIRAAVYEYHRGNPL